MNRDQLLGFAAGLGLLFLLGSIPSQVNNRYLTEQNIFTEFSNVYQNMQPKKWRVDISSPNLQNLQDHEVMFITGGNVRQAIRIGDKIYYSQAFTQ